MNTHGSDVSSSFTGDPEDSKSLLVVVFEQVRLVDGSDTKLTFDSGDQWRSLEHGASKRLDRLVDLLLILENHEQLKSRKRIKPGYPREA